MVFVVVFLAIFANSRYFKGQTKAQTININSDTYISSSNQIYDNDANSTKDIVVKNGATLTIDGSHTFENLKIETGGVLTTTDYNRYGVDVSSFESTPAAIQKASSLLSDDGKYVFVMRGLINTAGAQRTYGATSASDSNSFTPSDAAGIRFFKPIGFTQLPDGSNDPSSISGYTDRWYLESNKIGDAFSNSNNTYGTPTTFTDTESTAQKFLLPFELRFVKAKTTASSGDNFGIAYCNSSCNLTGTTGSGYSFIDVLKKQTDETPVLWSQNTVEMQSFKAWQGYKSTDKFYTSEDEYQTFSKFEANFNANMTLTADISDFNTYYVIAGYDFSDDPKVVLMGANYMNFVGGLNGVNLVLKNVDNQYETATSSPNPSRNRTKSVFLATSLLNSPFGCREESAGLFPTFSKQLLLSFRNKIRSNSILVNSEFEMQPNSKINLTGKGFAPAAIMVDGKDYGSGPGAGVGTSGASHAGVGGDATQYIVTSDLEKSPILIYDNVLSGTPALPGSGVSLKGLIGDPSIYYGYGGGFLNITASKVFLRPGASTTDRPMIYANGSGGNPAMVIPGASGGSVIINDSFRQSIYNGLITTTGAGVGGSTYGAGGGGNIYITTATDDAAIRARFDIIAPDVGTWPSSSDWFNGLPVTWWTSGSHPFSSEAIAFGGGKNATKPGDHGIAQAVKLVMNEFFRLRKSIKNINVAPGKVDQVEVTLTVVNSNNQPLTDGLFISALEDDFPNDGNPNVHLTPIETSPSGVFRQDAGSSCKFGVAPHPNSMYCTNLRPAVNASGNLELTLIYHLKVPN